MSKDNIFNNNKSIKDTKIVVAMSGGVDSSTVAALMHHQGYEVIGVTMQLYDSGNFVGKKGACCAGKDISDARNVANKLGIKHYVLNYENLFQESVIQDFVDSYTKGETPIPCVRCNQSVKFKDLFSFAKKLDADALVTGHYIQKIVKSDGSIELHQGLDPYKDQSYFLFATTKEQLKYLHFPIGNMNKEETRALAKKFDLDVFDKPDSQDICFVPDGNYKKIVTKYYPESTQKGDIVHISGKKLGSHNGIINFTIGQRKGLGISWPEPLYVYEINPNENIVIVSEEEYLYNDKILLKDINIINESIFDNPNIMVKIRSTDKLTPAKIIISKANPCNAEILLKINKKSISPGQACVFYLDTQVLGGGWIDK